MTNPEDFEATKRALIREWWLELRSLGCALPLKHGVVVHENTTGDEK